MAVVVSTQLSVPVHSDVQPFENITDYAQKFDSCSSELFLRLAFSENQKSLLKTSDVNPLKCEKADAVKKTRKALLKKCRGKRSQPEKDTKPKEAAVKQDVALPDLKRDLTKYLNENYKTTESGIRCIYLDADQPGKIMVETSQEPSKANNVLTQFLSKQYPADELNQDEVKKCFKMEKQESQLQYSWNGYNRITVADPPSQNFCSVGCPVTTNFKTSKMQGGELVEEEEWSQESFGYITTAHDIEKFVRDGGLSGSIRDQQMNNQVYPFENAPYKGVCGPYSRQDEENTYKAVDAAVIKIQDDSEQGGQYHFHTIFNGPPEELERSIQLLERVSPERKVYKTGSASGETVGYIQAADLTEQLTFQRNGQAPEHFYCDNVIRIRPAAGHPPFSLKGDSGAVVYRNINGHTEALGLVSRCATELSTDKIGITHAVYCANCRDALQDYCDIEVQLSTDK